MDVGVVGSGPAKAAIEAACSDVDVAIQSIGLESLGMVDIGAVIGRAGDGGFNRANEVCRDAGTEWVAIEIGGIGGVPHDGIDATITGIEPDGPCFYCLQQRTRAADPSRTAAATTDPTAVRLAGAIAGREVARIATGGARTLFGTIIELPYQSRQLLPIPLCPICSSSANATQFAAIAHRSVDLETAVSRAEKAIDPRVGIVTEIGELESFPAPYYLARTVSTETFSDATAPQEAAGVAEDWDVAFMKALGEAFERYGAGVYRTADFTEASAEVIDDPLDFDLLARPKRPATSEPISWVRGQFLRSSDSVAVPAELVYFPPNTRHFGPAITTGLGLGSSPAHAITSGLTEVIERDAIIIGWYSTMDPIGLTVDDAEYDRLRRRATSEGLDVIAVSMTQDVDIPVIVVTVSREGSYPRFAAGSAAHVDPTAAARNALSEALQNWMELRSMGPDRADEAGAWIGRYAIDPGPARDFFSIDKTVEASSIGASAPPTDEDVLPYLLDRTSEAGMDPIAVRVTTRDLERLGFEVARVIVPVAQPLFTSEPFFAPRATRVPRSMGFDADQEKPPHPFP